MTQWEDLGADAVTALADIQGGAYDTGDALNAIKEVKYDDLGSAFEGLKRNIELLIQPIGDALIPLIEEIVNEVLPQLQPALQPIIDSVIAFLPMILQMAEEFLPQLLDIITSLLPMVLQMAQEFFPILLTALAQLMPFIMQLITELLPPLMDFIMQLLPPIMEIITALLPPLIQILTALMPIILEIATALIPPLISVFEALMPPILQLIDALLPPLMDLLNMLMPCIQALTPVITTLAELFSVVLGAAIDLVMPIIQGLMDILGSVIAFITDVFSGNWEDAWNDIVDIFKGIFNFLPGIIETALNGAIGLINKLIDGINGVTEDVGIPAIPNIPDVTLPRFHTGGIVDFKGNYEGEALLKSGEMVLTQAQQKQLFDMANGLSMSMPSQQYSASNITNDSKIENKITNNNTFYVRSDSDINKISQKLSALENQQKSAIGGK